MADKIAVIEADSDIASLIRSRSDNYKIDVFKSLRPFLNAAGGIDYALVIVDASGLDIAVLSVIQSICSSNRERTMLLVIVPDDAQMRVDAFDAGADDCMGHPINGDELVFRVKHLIMRFNSQEHSDLEKRTLTVGDIFLDPESYEVLVAGSPINLTVTEFKLLHLLMKRSGRVQNREHLLINVWNYDAGLETRTVDTHIKRLRAKLGESAAFIETVRGVGYRFVTKDSVYV